MGNKFDYNFIKPKLLSKVFIEWKETIYNLYSEEGVFQQWTDAEYLVEKTISKELKKSIKSVNKGVKQFKKERKKLIKKGLIDVGYEKLKFMFETGIYNPQPEEPAEEQEELPEIFDAAKNPDNNPKETESKEEESGEEQAETSA